MDRNLYHLYLWTWLVLRFCNDLMSRKLIRYGMKFPWPCVLQSIYSFLCLWYSKEKVIGNSFVTQMFRMTSEYAMTLRQGSWLYHQHLIYVKGSSRTKNKLLIYLWHLLSKGESHSLLLILSFVTIFYSNLDNKLFLSKEKKIPLCQCAIHFFFK